MIVTPLQVARWEQGLTKHSDKAFEPYNIQGIQLSFQVGFHIGEVTCQSTHTNMPSASHLKRKIDKFFAIECVA